MPLLNDKKSERLLKRMEKEKLKLNDLKERTQTLKIALNDFLAEHQLTLSKQNYDRALSHLLACMADYDDVTSDDVQGYLNEVLDYHEHNISMMNKTGIAEESLVNILITADYDSIVRPDVPQWKMGWRSLPLPIAVSLVLLIGAAFAKPVFFSAQNNTAQYQVITIDQEEKIKQLVQDITQVGGVSYNTIYNRLKTHPEISALGYASSYKKFNQAQYQLAMDYLNTWKSALENGAEF